MPHNEPDFRPAVMFIANATFNGTNLTTAEFETMEACTTARGQLEELEAGSSFRAVFRCFPKRLASR